MLDGEESSMMSSTPQPLILQRATGRVSRHWLHLLHLGCLAFFSRPKWSCEFHVAGRVTGCETGASKWEIRCSRATGEWPPASAGPARQLSPSVWRADPRGQSRSCVPSSCSVLQTASLSRASGRTLSLSSTERWTGGGFSSSAHFRWLGAFCETVTSFTVGSRNKRVSLLREVVVFWGGSLINQKWINI